MTVRVQIDHRDACRQSAGLRRHGDRLICRACGRSATIPSGNATDDRPPDPIPPPGQPALYVIVCIDCDRAMWSTNSKARVPLCDGCRRTRAKRQPKPSRPDAVARAMNAL